MSITPLAWPGDHSPTTGRSALDIALSKLVLPVAALRRAGPFYVQQSEAFWVFAAGSWSRSIYDQKVREAVTRSPERRSVSDDATLAEVLVNEIIVFLRQSGDARDARDLEEVTELYSS